jgi:Uri superfamily endonuclease
MIALPSQAGSYALELLLEEPARLQIGRLGEFHFPAGHYIYLGSACGPGGLRARLGRHLDAPGAHPLRWHIDYLRQRAVPLAASCFAFADLMPAIQRLECQWSKLLFRLPESFLPAPGFGAGDCACKCPAHLVGFRPETGQPLLQDPHLRLALAGSGGRQVEIAFHPLV